MFIELNLAHNGAVVFVNFDHVIFYEANNSSPESEGDEGAMLRTPQKGWMAVSQTVKQIDAAIANHYYARERVQVT